MESYIILDGDTHFHEGINFLQAKIYMQYNSNQNVSRIFHGTWPVDTKNYINKLRANDSQDSFQE